MITIDHEPGYAPMIFITGADTFKCDPAYYLGTDGRSDIPPNYPMPVTMQHLIYSRFFDDIPQGFWSE